MVAWRLRPIGGRKMLSHQTKKCLDSDRAFSWKAITLKTQCLGSHPRSMGSIKRDVKKKVLLETLAEQQRNLGDSALRSFVLPS